MDQAVELYRLKNRVTVMENAEQTLKAKLTRMENLLKEKAMENQRLQVLNNFYEKEVTKLLNKHSKQSTDVRNYFLVHTFQDMIRFDSFYQIYF